MKILIGLTIIAIAISVMFAAAWVSEKRRRVYWNKLRDDECEIAMDLRKQLCDERRHSDMLQKENAELHGQCEKLADKDLRLEAKNDELLRENDRLSCILHGEVHTAFGRLPRDAEIITIDERKFYVRDGDLCMIFEDGGYAGYFLGDVDERLKKQYEAPGAIVR